MDIEEIGRDIDPDDVAGDNTESERRSLNRALVFPKNRSKPNTITKNNDNGVLKDSMGEKMMA